MLGIFGGRNGELYVIVSKRSSKLRSHAGESATRRVERQEEDWTWRYEQDKRYRIAVGYRFLSADCSFFVMLDR